MGYELRRIWEIFNKNKLRFVIIWCIAIVFSTGLYFISQPGYKSSAQIGMENTRKPWSNFKKGQLPNRRKLADKEEVQMLSLRDPFWNFLYDQLEKSTYDFTPFFHARTTVFRIIDDLDIRHHFDNGSMTSEEVVLAFTENLEVEFDRVGGLYNISFTFVEPEIARAVVNRHGGHQMKGLEDKSDTAIAPISEILFDPLLYIILTRIFFDSMNLAQAEITYLENTEQLEYFQQRSETSKRLLSRRMSEDELARGMELKATLAEESGKAVFLLAHKTQIESEMSTLPDVEKEFVYLHRKKLALRATLSGLQDLREIGINYLEKGDKIATVLDSPYLPKRKDDPQFLKILLSVLLATTVCGFGWFFIRENIEVHATKN